MALQAGLAVLSLLLLLSLCVEGQVSTPPSLANFSPDQQKNATQFVNQRCFPEANGIVSQIQNGFATAVPYTVVLQCQGTGNATFEVTVAPFSVSEPFLIQPSTGAVSNRLCSLLLTGIDPHDASALPSKITFQNFTTTCGAVQVRNRDFDEDADDDCHFADAPCEYNKGSWYYGFLPTTIHAFIITAVILIPFGIFAYISNHALENLIIGAGASRRDYGSHLQEAVDKWRQTEQPHPAHLGYKAGGGRAMRHDDDGESDDDDEYAYDDSDGLKQHLESGGMISMEPMSDRERHHAFKTEEEDDSATDGFMHRF